MQANRHQSICHIIDKSLAGAASAQEEQALREHLLTCAACSDYLGASNRAIASLEGFRFDVDPGLNSKLFASLALRSQQLDAERIQRKRLLFICVIAPVFTVFGSFAASQLGSFAATVFHLESARIQFGLATFWIAPSLCFCLLLLLLPVCPALWMNKKGILL
jgi:hypothetical protein